MDHPRVIQQVDLGQCLLRASNSRLQLQFTATAHFSKPAGQSGGSHLKVSQWQDLSSIWVTEAPELDISLFIRAAQGLEHPMSALMADLGDKLLTSPIWSDIGFVVRLKDPHSAHHLDSLGLHRLTIGLCREDRVSTVKKGWTLPSILQKPPDAHPPLDVPTITLASIDIYLEYNFPPQLEERFCDLMACNLDSIMDFDQWFYRSKIEAFAVATLTVSAQEAGSACSEHVPSHLDVSSPSHQEDSIGDNISTSQILLQLLDSGLQRLIISASSRRPQTRTVGKNTLQNLSRLFPVIFNPGYREAMNQRAASIPIISRALTSMLENSNNPFLRGKIPDLQATNDPSTTETGSSSSQNTPNSAIHSTLWRMAQDQTRRPRPIKRGTSFFATDQEPGPETRQQTLVEEPQFAGVLTEDEFEDIDLLDLDQYDALSHATGTEPASQRIPQPHYDGGMELICEDSPGSTQTTMIDGLFVHESTQTTLDEFASACDPDPIPFDCSDTEMLF